MRRWILMAGAALLLLSQGALAAPTYEGTDQNPGQKPPAMIWHRITLDTSTTQSRNFALGQSCSVKFTKVGAGNVVLYEVPTSSAAYTSGVAETTFTASTTEAYTFKPGASYGTVRAASDSDGSIVEISCLNDGTFSVGGGGGAPAAEYAALSSIDESTISHVTVIDCDDLTCAAPGTGSTRVPFYYNGSAWVPFPGAAAGIASVVEDTTPTLGGNLDADGNDITGVSELASKKIGAVFYSARYGSGLTGITSALSACSSAGGGSVVLPPGLTTIDATGLTAPLIDLPGVVSVGTTYGVCALRGFGFTANSGQGAGTEKNGTTIRVTNSSSMTAGSDGLKSIVSAKYNGQVIEDFLLDTDSTDATVRGIVLGRACVDLYDAEGPPQTSGSPDGNCDSTGSPPTSTNNVNVRRVGVRDTDLAVQNAIGIDLHFLKDSSIEQVEVSGWDDGIQFNGYAGAASNTNTISNSQIRDNDQGITINAPTASAPACRQLALIDNTIESNDVTGLLFSLNSDCNAVDYSPHYEANGTNGVRINGAGVTYISIGGSYGGAQTNDIYRGLANTNGPDVCIGCRWENVFNYGGTGRVIKLIAPSQIGTLTVVSNSQVYGHIYTHATNCPANAPLLSVAGDVCAEVDDNTLYVCVPGADDVCDTSGEWDGPYGAGGGGGPAYATIDDEDTPLTQRTTLNFEGAGVSCADDVDQTTCTIAGQTSTAANDPLYDALGDIVAGIADNTAARVAIGTPGQVLGVVAGPFPGWISIPGGTTAATISALTQKATPVVADHLLIEDSAASDAKKRITVGAMEPALEGVMDLQDMQGAVTDSQVPDDITLDTILFQGNFISGGSTLDVADWTTTKTCVKPFDSPLMNDGQVCGTSAIGDYLLFPQAVTITGISFTTAKAISNANDGCDIRLTTDGGATELTDTELQIPTTDATVTAGTEITTGAISTAVPARTKIQIQVKRGTHCPSGSGTPCACDAGHVEGSYQIRGTL